MRVNGVGPLNAKIMFIGEAPGEQEDASGLPFIGQSGKLLNDMLGNVGIDRTECYLTNVVKHRPPNNDFGIFYNDRQKRDPSTQLLLAYKELRDEIQQIQPNVIVPLGGEALRAVTGKTGIDAWRGSILFAPVGGRNYKCVPSLHPAYVLRQYPSRCIVELDLRRALEESVSPTAVLPSVTFQTRPSYADVITFLQHRPKRVAFDIETTGPHVRSLALSTELNHAICIPFISTINRPIQPGTTTLFLAPAGGETPTSHWTEEEERGILESLYKFFSDPTIEKIAHNYPFDASILAREFGLNFTNIYMDTMVAHHACYAELPKGLDFLCSIYTRHPYYSDYDAGNDEQTWKYNCYDAAVTLECSYRIEKELQEMGLTDFYFSQKHPTTLSLVRVEHRGVRIDQEKRAEIAGGFEKRIAELAAEIRAIAGDPTLNPNSDKQIKALLYDKLKLPIQYNPKTKAPSTDKHAILRLKQKCPQHENLLNQIMEHSSLCTIISGFFRKELGPDSRIRTHFNSAATVTDRLNSSEPLFDIGTNLQNIPVREHPECRSPFIPDPGYTWIKADLSQAEFRIVAWLGRIERVIRQYSDNPKWRVHRYVASLLYSKPEDQVTKAEDGDAKNGVYGGNYAMQPAKAAMVYKIPFAKAKFILNKYRYEIFPEIPKWWAEVFATINSTRTIRGPFNNHRLFLDRLGVSLEADIYRDAYSHSAQNIVANLINRALHLIENTFVENECHILLQIHDELDFQCRTDLVPKYAPLIKRFMEYPLYFPGVEQPLIVPAEVSTGPNWLDQTKLEL